MAETSKIEWTDATPVIDRGGRRVRLYHRMDSSRPGQQIRRRMLANGSKWCRSCRGWLAADLVGKNGLCRPHENADAKARYHGDAEVRERRRAHSYRRNRNVERMPPVAAENLLELFDGECAYCPSAAATWDHVRPVSKGGTTVEGNMVPACRRCNSAKRDLDIEAWLDRAPMIKPYTIEYLSVVGDLDGVEHNGVPA